MRILLTIALVFPLALAASGQESKKVQPDTEKFQGKKDEEIEKERQRLEGTWSGTLAGVLPSGEDTHKIRTVIKGDRITVTPVEEGKGNPGAMACRFTLVPDKRPRGIDLKWAPEKGVLLTLPGICELEGDTLKVCFSFDPKDRPTKFAPQGRDPAVHLLWVLKRETVKIDLAVKAAPPTEEERAIAALRKAGGQVLVLSNRPEKKPLRVSFAGTQVSDADLPPLKNLNLTRLDLTGTRVKTLQKLEGLSSLRMLDLRDTQVGDAGLARLKELTLLESLVISGTKVTDRGLGDLLGGLKHVWVLDLGRTATTDAGLEHVGRLSGLGHLWLNGTKITDGGIERLKGLRQLQSLDLSLTPITDKGLAQLKGFEKLETLTLVETRVTDVGVQELQKAFPNLKITR